MWIFFSIFQGTTRLEFKVSYGFMSSFSAIWMVFSNFKRAGLVGPFTSQLADYGLGSKISRRFAEGFAAKG